jgi:hypothetical protein
MNGHANASNASETSLLERICKRSLHPTGRLANNTNLAAKGIVALEAFAYLCTVSDRWFVRSCDRLIRSGICPL